MAADPSDSDEEIPELIPTTPITWKAYKATQEWHMSLRYCGVCQEWTTDWTRHQKWKQHRKKSLRRKCFKMFVAIEFMRTMKERLELAQIW